MFQQEPLKLVVIGAALATVAAVLVPVNVFLLIRGVIPLLIVLVIVQVLLLAAAGFVMYEAHKKSRE